MSCVKAEHQATDNGGLHHFDERFIFPNWHWDDLLSIPLDEYDPSSPFRMNEPMPWNGTGVASSTTWARLLHGEDVMVTPSHNLSSEQPLQSQHTGYAGVYQPNSRGYPEPYADDEWGRSQSPVGSLYSYDGRDTCTRSPIRQE